LYRLHSRRRRNLCCDCCDCRHFKLHAGNSE